MSALIDAHRDEFGVEPICRALGVAPSTYYAVKARERDPSARALSDERLLVGGSVGCTSENSASMAPARSGGSCEREGIKVARCTVERLMASRACRARSAARGARTTIPDGQAQRPPDLVERDFNARARTVCGSPTSRMSRPGQGVCYVAFVIDVFSRRIVGWKADTTMKTSLVLDTLEMALWARDHHGQPVADGLVSSLRCRRSIHAFCVHPAARRCRRRPLGRVGRRRVRQRAGRDDDRALQDRADQPRRPVEDARARSSSRRWSGSTGTTTRRLHGACDGCPLPSLSRLAHSDTMKPRL